VSANTVKAAARPPHSKKWLASRLK